jgi:ATP-dependent helicase STH1/SNF2
MDVHLDTAASATAAAAVTAAAAAAAAVAADHVESADANTDTDANETFALDDDNMQVDTVNPAPETKIESEINGTTEAETETGTGTNTKVPIPDAVALPRVPVPQSRKDVELMLNHLAKLHAADINKPEQQAILNMLKRIDIKSSQSQANADNSVKAWKENDEIIDKQLLKKQLLGLQLLAKDIDLPTELALEYLQTGSDHSIKDPVNELLHNGTDTTTIPATASDLVTLPSTLPLDDYNRKAEMLGITPNRPVVDPNFNVVGLPELEDSVKFKIDSRIRELESLPANLGTYDFDKFENDLKYSNDKVLDNVDQLKIDALVELKSLKLLPLQKQLRNHLLIKAATNTIYHDENLNNYSVFQTWKRTYCVHPKQKVVQTAKLAEKLQQQQLQEKKKLIETIHNEKVQHLMEYAAQRQNHIAQNKIKRFQLGKAIHHYHVQSERDQSKKFERNAKQRLQALKANDEEAYIKLLDQTKDKRITHLLKQTNSFLGSLADAVKVQQHEARVLTQLEKGEKLKKIEEEEEAEADEEKDKGGDDKNEKIDYYEVAHKVKETVTEQPKLLVGGTLKEYQLKGLEWMVSLYNNHLNGILADEMGLGKTIQSIALITYLIERKNETGKFLIIVPLSTITNWTLEFEQWAPSLKTVVYKGNQQQRRDLQYQIRSGDFNVLLTTFEYVIKDRPLLCKFKWAHMLIDEGHRLKNTGSKLFQTLTTYYHTRNRLILTGTPLQNSLPELWALLNFILPKVFNSVKSFDEWFNTPFANTGHQEKLELSEEESLLIIRRLHKVLRPFLLRRLKKDVAKDLPDKVEKVIKCKFSSLQAKIYKQLLNYNAIFIGEGQVGATKSGLKGLNNKIMQLRKACNHPFVFEEVETVVNPEKSTTDMIWRSAGKFELLDRILPKLKRTGHRVLIFFQMTQVMDIMEDYLRFRDLKYMRLDGSTKADDRQSMLKDFNDPESDYFCFLLSTRAGGLGLNLQTADTVVIFDTDWNPHQDLQAQDRAHRIGQKNEVRILRLITSESVEEVILERAHQKLDIDGKVIQAGKFDNKSSAEEQEAYLKKLIEEEKDTNIGEENGDFDDNEINEILARSDTEIAVFEQMDAERLAEDKARGTARLMTDDEVPQVFKEDMKVHLEEKDDGSGRRERKAVIYDDGLTEEQWLQAMDNDNDTVEAAIERKRTRMEKMRKSRGLDDNEDGDDSVDDSMNNDGDASRVDDAEDTPANGRDAAEDDPDDEEVYAEDVPSRKRQRLSRGGSSTPVPPTDAGGSTTSGNSRKKVKAPPPKWHERAFALLGAVETISDEDGNDVSSVFLKLPSRKFYADYFKLIQHPVSLEGLRKQLEGRKLKTLDAFTGELKQMFANARFYNEEGSWVCKCADLLEAKMNEFLKKWEEESELEEDQA